MLSAKGMLLDRRLSVKIAIKYARDCIHVWDAVYPNDKRPLKAIEAAEAWLSNPCEETSSAVCVAADRVVGGKHAGRAMWASDSAYYAAAGNLKLSLSAHDIAMGHNSFRLREHSIVLNHLSQIIDYKIRHNQIIGNFEEVFEAASDECREKLLFNLNLAK